MLIYQLIFFDVSVEFMHYVIASKSLRKVSVKYWFYIC